MKKSLMLPSIFVLSLFAILFSPASSANVSAFNAGRIIDDTVFANSSTMSADDIQSFLNSKVPVCDTWGTKMYNSWQTRAQFAATIGKYPPFTCLKDYSENGLSAAQIIYNTSQNYRINPQVLLVLLQKEQGLVTDTWPYDTQYRSATGYGCPDTAACSTTYYGFTNQVSWASRMFRSIMDASPYWYTPYVVGNNYIRYNPNAACGGSNVYIENRATQALYNYTPYQPNQAALDAGWGTAPCGAYGNRNFYLYFTSWFGPTTGTAFFQLPGSPTTYVYGANNTYYRIVSYERLLDYGFTTKFNSRVDQLTNDAVSTMTLAGDLPAVSRFEGDAISVISDSTSHPFPSAEVFHAYGYNFGNEANLPSWLGRNLNNGGAVQQVAHSIDTAWAYYVDNGKKHRFCNGEAYNSTGSPIYSTRPTTILRDSYLSSIPSGSPIAGEGDVIVSSDYKTYGLWQNGVYNSIESSVASILGAENCLSTQDAIDQLPKSSSTISNLVKSANGKRFILDERKKLEVDDTGGVNTGIDDSKYVSVNDSFINRVSKTEKLNELVRINNNDGVYVIETGRSFIVPSPDDLYGLGFNFSQVQSVSNKTLQLFNAGGIKYKPGRVIRIGQQEGVYLIDGNFKRYDFTNASDFLGYGYSWSDISSVDSTMIQSYSYSGPVKPYVKDETGNYWLINKSKRYKVTPTLLQPSLYAVSDTNSNPLSYQIISKLPESTLTKVFRADLTDSVYMIENGQKRAFTSASALLGRGFKWSDVMSLSSTYVNSLPNGAPVI